MDLFVMQVFDQEPSDSRCFCALARRRYNQPKPVFVTHPVTGMRHLVKTPPGTFHPERLVKAMESVKSGKDPDAVMKLVRPFGLNGPNPRPELLSCVFQTMFAVGGHSRTTTTR